MNQILKRNAVAAQSIFELVAVGIDEFDVPVRLPLIYRQLLPAGEPGSGKSGGLNDVVAHAALSTDCLAMADGTASASSSAFGGLVRRPS